MFTKMQELRELKDEKRKLEKNLAHINNCMNQQKENCFHVMVYLGYNGFPVIANKYKYRCLICGELDNEKIPFKPEYIIHAEDYLPQYDTQDKEQCDEKFDNIQALALNLLRENPDLSREEMVIKLNHLIQEDISFRRSENKPKLVKTRNDI